MKFSQRVGVTPLKKVQLTSIDGELKNRLWNIYVLYILNKIPQAYDFDWPENPRKIFSKAIWLHYFNQPVDRIPVNFLQLREYIRTYFFSCSWYEIYDLIESTINLLPNLRFPININDIFSAFNETLEREFSAYRFISGVLSPITNSTEMTELNDALLTTGNFTLLQGCNTHLREAQFKLSDKQNPDYRNSIKESISAVESIAKAISNNSKDTLGDALDNIKDKLEIHSALAKGFKQIYGYTSNAGGIRHALSEGPSCDLEDARFMLISCSAFINYIVAKCTKVGINLP
jgi:hypothetical protein